MCNAFAKVNENQLFQHIKARGSREESHVITSSCNDSIKHVDASLALWAFLKLHLDFICLQLLNLSVELGSWGCALIEVRERLQEVVGCTGKVLGEKVDY